MVWNRTSFAKFHRIVSGIAIPIRTIMTISHVENDQENWIVIRDAHSPLISRLQFEQAQQRRVNTKKFGVANTGNVGRGARSPYLLSGLIYCAHCGYHWIGYTIHQGRRIKGRDTIKNPYYLCNGYVTKGKKICPRLAIPKEQLEVQVINKIAEMIQQRFQTPEGLTSIKQLVQEVIQEDIPKIDRQQSDNNARIREINQTIHNLIDNLTPTNRDFVDQRLIELKHELSTLELKQMDLEQLDAKKIDTVKLIEQAVMLAQQFQAVFAEGTTEEKRLFIRSFVSKIEIDPITLYVNVEFLLMPGLEQAKWKAQEK